MQKKRNRTQAFCCWGFAGAATLARVTRTTIPREELACMVSPGLYTIESIFSAEEAAAREAERQARRAVWEKAEREGRTIFY
jgi:hypothetical protein